MNAIPIWYILKHAGRLLDSARGHANAEEVGDANVDLDQSIALVSLIRAYEAEGIELTQTETANLEDLEVDQEDLQTQIPIEVQ